VIAADEGVSVVRCDDPFMLAKACYHLGNRHVPLQIMPGELRYHHDHVLDDMLRQFGLEVTFASCRLNRKPAPTPAKATVIIIIIITSTATKCRRGKTPAADAAGQQQPAGRRLQLVPGLEWAVEAGWVPDAAFERWQLRQMEQSFLPSTCRCSPACTGPANGRSAAPSAGPPICSPAGRPANCGRKSATAARPLPACWPTGSRTARRVAHAVPAKPARRHGVARRALANRLPDLALSLGYSWIESAVMAGVKLVPFGQQAAQQLILRLCDRYAADMPCALAAPDARSVRPRRWPPSLPPGMKPSIPDYSVPRRRYEHD
jgi:urease accessory protein